MVARVLVVAGSDSGGGAGIQADIKTITALGGFAMTAVTALTAQNTLGVLSVMAVPPDFIEQQLEAVLTDLGADVVKTGMLHDARVIERVVRTLDRLAPGVPLVVDPVMVAKGGAPLLAADARGALLERLVPRAALLTPNIPEAEALTGLTIVDEAGMERAADALLLRGAAAVLIKGGHLPSEELVDLLRTADGDGLRLSCTRQRTSSTHGTGCTLASAIATGVGEGLTLRAAVERAHRYVQLAIRTAIPLGQGHGPLNHAHPFLAFADPSQNGRP